MHTSMHTQKQLLFSKEQGERKCRKMKLEVFPSGAVFFSSFQTLCPFYCSLHQDLFTSNRKRVVHLSRPCSFTNFPLSLKRNESSFLTNTYYLSHLFPGREIIHNFSDIIFFILPCRIHLNDFIPLL